MGKLAEAFCIISRNRRPSFSPFLAQSDVLFLAWQSSLCIRVLLTPREMEDVPERHDFPTAEEAVAAWWTKVDAFKTSLKRNEGKPRYSFYDGPPFATGTPHYGHILAGTIKDTVTRYAAQNGFYVERRYGVTQFWCSRP